MHPNLVVYFGHHAASMASTPPPWSWPLPLLVAAGFVIVRWFAARTGGTLLRELVVGSYAVRVVLAVLLYAMSYWQWPVLSSLQFGNGFWVFAVDSNVYHYEGGLIASAWRAQIPVLPCGLGVEYTAVIAGLYRLLGAHPLYPIVLNCALAASLGLLAYAFSRRFLSERAAVTAAALVSWWPSTFIWSAQLLKDALTWWLLFAALGLLARALAGPAMTPRASVARWLMTSVGLGIALIALTSLRVYLGTSLLISAALLALPLAFRALWHGRLSRAIPRLALLGVMAVSVLTARAMMTPRRVFYLQFGAALAAHGQLGEAREMFERTLSLAESPQQRAALEAIIALSRQEWTAGAQHALVERTSAIVQNEAQRGTIWSRLAVECRRLRDELRVGRLANQREGFVQQRPVDIPGMMPALIDREARVTQPFEALMYLPRALAVGFLAPFPWQWLDTQGSTGAMRTVAGLEMLLVYLLLPAILLGVVRTLRARRPEGFLLLAVVGVMAIPLSLVVANLGTLFRLRLLFLLPLLLVAAQGEPWRTYTRVIQRNR